MRFQRTLDGRRSRACAGLLPPHRRMGSARAHAHWHELGFHHAPDFAIAQSQHDSLCRELRTAGAEVIELPAPPDLSLDAVYAHDASLPTDFGLIVMRPGKPNRLPEGPRQASFCQTLQYPCSRLPSPRPATTEAGDMLWLDSKTSADRPRLPHQRRRYSADARSPRDPKESKFSPRHSPTAPAHPPACI